MERNFSHAIRDFNVWSCNFRVEFSTENRPDANYWLMFTPCRVIRLSIGHCQISSVAIPWKRSYLIITIQTCDNLLNFGLLLLLFFLLYLRFFMRWFIPFIVDMCWCATRCYISLFEFVEGFLYGNIGRHEVEVRLKNVQLIYIFSLLFPHNLIVVERSLLKVSIECLLHLWVYIFKPVR